MDFLQEVPTLIIANGRFPTNPLPLSLIKKAEFIVCTDGAANSFIAAGGVPNAIVGDCDSISDENRKRFAEIVYLNEDQEINDLTKSVNFCVQNGRTDIVIIAATGKRDDHTIGNISLLAEYINIANTVMMTDKGIFTPINSTQQFKSFKGQQVSIFAIDPKEISSSNLKYPLKNRVLTNWWQGTLNESLGESFTIESMGRAIVFQLYR